MQTLIRWMQMLIIAVAGIWLIACGDSTGTPIPIPTTIQATPNSGTQPQNLIAQGTPSMSPASGGKPSSPFIVQLKPEILNPLNQVSTLVFSATSRILDSPNTLVVFELPPNVVLVSGVLTQRSDFQANIPQTFRIQIKPVMVGEFSIKALVYYGQPGDAYGGSDGFYLNVTDQQTTIIEAKPLPPCEWPMPAVEVGQEPQVSPTPCR